jgi:hypothetical protein
MSHHGDHTTGTSDEQYDLVSVLYHALEGAATCEVYNPGRGRSRRQ